jgi:hypothetical protein
VRQWFGGGGGPRVVQNMSLKPGMFRRVKFWVRLLKQGNLRQCVAQITLGHPRSLGWGVT